MTLTSGHNIRIYLPIIFFIINLNLQSNEYLKLSDKCSGELSTIFASEVE